MDRIEIDPYFSIKEYELKELELRRNGYESYLDSFFLKRLKGISFLGVLDHVYNLKNPSSRYVHTICVSNLALHLARRLSLPSDLERALVIANLLHDVGHSAFSHNSEPFLLENLNLYHQGLLSAFLIRGNSFAPSGESLSDLLSSENETVRQHVNDLILKSRKAIEPINTLYHGPINCDKIDGNYRTLYHLGKDGPNPNDLVDIFDIKASKIIIKKNKIDLIINFWQKERDVYWNDIYTPRVFAAEAMLTRALKIFFDGPGNPEKFLFMTDDQALDTIKSSAIGYILVDLIIKGELYLPLSKTHPEIFSEFKTRIIKSRFDLKKLSYLEEQIAEYLGVKFNHVIIHFSRRKHFEFRFDQLIQRDLFEDNSNQLSLNRVSNLFNNTKRSGDFFDIFWYANNSKISER